LNARLKLTSDYSFINQMEKRFDCTCLKKCNVKNDGKAVITFLFQSSHFIVDNVSVGFT